MIPEDKIPDTSSPKSTLFHSWVILISVSLVMIAAGGSRGAFGVFFKPMVNDLGWSAAQISGTFSFSMIVEGIVSAVSGWLSDKFGTKIVLVIGGLIAGSGLVLMSQVHTMWQMYIIYGIAMGVGLGGVFVPIVSLLAKRFTTNRSFMTGIALGANGLGQMFSPLIANHLIIIYDWRNSYIILGIIVFLLIAIPAQFIKRPRKRVEDVPQTINSYEKSFFKHPIVSFTFDEARHTRTFWMMIFMFGLCGFCFAAIAVHLVPHAIEMGISASTAANIQACLGGATIVGRLGLSKIADRMGNRRMIVIGFIMLTVSLLWLVKAQQVWALILFTILCGLGFGGITTSQSPLSARYFGSKSHGSTFGVMGGMAVMIGATGSFAIGFLFDLTGQYQVPFIVLALVSLAGMTIGLLLRPPEKKKTNLV
jgi:MFS family permease